jgi:hypothetical protein
MVRSKSFRIAVGSASVLVALLLAAPAYAASGTLTATAPKKGQPGYPTCKYPSKVTNGCDLNLVFKGGSNQEAVAVTECGSDYTTKKEATTCDSNPSNADSGNPGEILVLLLSKKGKLPSTPYPVLVGNGDPLGTNAKSSCVPGKKCTLVLADINSQKALGSVTFTAGG